VNCPDWVADSCNLRFAEDKVFAENDIPGIGLPIARTFS
jgi:hypothetical protein